MPVLLEHIKQPTAADWADIAKIQADTADEQLQAPMLQQRLANQGWIIAARFNDRIVGVILCTQNQQTITLSNAAVRTITQRRGVIHQTIHLLQHWARDQAMTLRIETAPDTLAPALEKRGFEFTESAWVWQP
ncbi:MULTISPECIES: acetyl-CoA sensor PanZ family protein [unclassified Oceanobacter]|uniref:acetyl-CoA sensor PanZ family protein n=1 Tax=unclassified Oceanobacter TaxID=2620260 RepID=UPI0026E1C588|nr:MULTISPECIES: acetyl-CoA sensor PanZ family protein [unclassified Oceanobacter]MDO6682865.1 acetyl-CoA sensor PanZ family protein [Oceanobacter sp. 5_MG-2023]MDP2505624.1 acetyl-CoA sensor PanZ family protein [Oceanobacter sp. 3_MG-2023]MDP2547206.1 acetyl-CoA sensor PanZ family protein [Oceanobacter sp. 4_MG-2023]MDP2609375.1 acetyl-CoA sensor PanZ family protein [Oceanobacter sp. 1_MG-2023]MDP2612758.1 acetyl-CoA sensor PanZ family protein [Oceanobacter sp. 2_MG-2023]